MSITLARLKREYNDALRDGIHTFLIDGHIIVTRYAKYMIQYLEGQGIPEDAKIEIKKVMGYWRIQTTEK